MKIRNLFKKIIVVTLTLTLIISFSMIKNVKAQENLNLINEIYYIDGIKYIFTLDDNMNIVVETECGEKLMLDKNGRGILESDDIKDDDSYSLEVNDLSNNELDIEITDSQGSDIPDISENVSEVDTVDELMNTNSDEYTGQSSASTAKRGLMNLLGACLATILWAGAKIINGVAALVGSKVKEALQKKPKTKNYYYSATIYNGDCYVLLGNGISLEAAARRLNSKLNIYTYYKSNARKAIVKSKYYVYKNKRGEEIEIDSAKNRKKGKTYYWHYHIANSKNKKIANVHAWYGSPVIK